MWWRHALGVAALIVLAAGCATTPTAQGNTALREGRPAEAAEKFSEALASEPERLDARIGLGISQFRLGAYDDAIRTLTEAVDRSPSHAGARLFLALAHLRKRDDAKAQEQLAALRALPLEPRFLALVEQTQTLLRAGPASDATRTYVVASLDYASTWSRELAETRHALRSAQMAADAAWSRPPYYILRCRNC